MENIKEWFRNIFMFVSSNRKLVLGLAVVAFILIVSVFIYANHKKATEETHTITTTYSAPDTPLAPDIVLDAAKANGKTISNNDANDIARLANRSVSNEKAYAHSITTSSIQADEQAKEIAKDRKADMVIKQTSENKQASNDKITVNDNYYYIIQQTRKHSVSVGAAAIDSKAYATVSYRNRSVTYTGYYNPQSGETGASVSVQVASW